LVFIDLLKYLKDCINNEKNNLEYRNTKNNVKKDKNGIYKSDDAVSLSIDEMLIERNKKQGFLFNK